MQSTERAILLALLKRRGKQPKLFSATLGRKVIGWLVIATISALAFMCFGAPSGAIVITAFAAFLVGAFMGVAWTIASSRSQWPFIEKHMNFESIEARLRELET